MSCHPFVVVVVAVVAVAEDALAAVVPGSVQWLRQKRIGVTKNWRVLSKTVARGRLKTVAKDLLKTVAVVVPSQMVAVYSSVVAAAYLFPYLDSGLLVQKMSWVAEADFHMNFQH